ncbi:hypothetical protein KGA66_03830 [Actinocrinis puniceicyclus]|uniref:Glycerophosphoryl diester phosphodiesterase membrane domain-containing protein n=1 Tax=Actinocrinis puniceicyclus TaxID=977794 RepID=A0A8J7WH54_9ACTN|nr:hypothetical protein [Actinocrinis puniceicyclus]MBS2962161.1 hypothetical protein [Actinocrinis puniceicyclus]
MPELPTAWASPGAPAPEATRVLRAADGRGPAAADERIARPVPLRPLSILELVDGAVGAVRTVPVTLLGWTSLLVVGAALVDFMLTWLFDSAVAAATRVHPVISTDELGSTFVEYGRTRGAGTFGVFVVHAALPIVCSGFAVTILAGLFAEPVKRYVDGASSAGAGTGETRQRLGRLVALAAVTAFPRAVFVALYALATLLVVDDPQGGHGAAMAWITILCGPMCAVLTADWAVAAPAAALEDARRLSGLRRSHRLVTAGRWRVLWATSLTLLIATVTMLPLISCQYYIGSAFGVRDLLNGDPVPGTAYWWLAGYVLALTLVQVLTAPFRAAAAVMLYVDRRFRREGLDIRIAWARVARALTAGKGR